jgi:23S rRNA pseudouridine2605 synthase
MRLNRYLSSCGVASRRASDGLVAEGRVTVNGVVSAVGTKVKPGDTVAVDGRVVVPRRGKTTIAFHKPRGVITTMTDPRGRPCVADYLPPELGRVFPVGRLDADTSGLLIITDDGDLAQRIAHPSHVVAKRYRVTVRGKVTKEAIAALRRGVVLEDGPTLPARVQEVERFRDGGRFALKITEGRNRQVRRMCHAVKLTVVELVREAVGSVELKDLPEGGWRVLTAADLKGLE